MSIKKEPKGAVIRMESTAIVRMVSPEVSPADKGIPPIAA